MSPSAEAFVRRLTAKGIQSDGRGTPDGGDVISVWFSGAQPDVTYEILTVIDPEETSAVVRCYSIVPVPAPKQTAMLRAINQLNQNYRWVKFYLDEDSEVAAGADAIITRHTAADVIYELLVRTLNIIDDSYVSLRDAANG